MNTLSSLRSCIVVSVIAAHFAASPCSFAADLSSQLAGKNLIQNRGVVNKAMQGRSYVVELGRHGEIKQILDAGANGAGKEAQPDVAIAEAELSTDQAETGSGVALPDSYQGQSALDFVGEELPKIAAEHGLTADKLKDMLLTDSTLHIDQAKRIFYVDEAADGHDGHVAAPGSAAAGATEETASANALALPIGSAPLTANAFKLHSKPGASKTIYLDFDGHTASNTAWSATTLQAPAFDLDGNPAVFSDAEKNNIISIWGRVAEDYIPFDADVTTEPPTDDALIRSSKTDMIYGVRVVITKKGIISCSCGGVAYVNVVAWVNNAAYQPAWVFQDSLGNSEKNIAEAAAHEAGHNLGLFHDGQKTATTTIGYYAGHGAGATGWAPIMGVGYYKNVSQWSRGEYPNANNLQDDFAVLATNGFVQRADDVGNTLATASPLRNAAATATTTQRTGVIESAGDSDMYRVDTTGGPLNVTVKPAVTGPNLDTALTLYAANGSVIATSAPETDLSASISTTLAAGTYYLGVKGSARAAVGSDYGYPATGSLGQYLLTAAYPPAGAATAATTASVSAASAGGTAASPLAVALAAPSVAKIFASSLKIKALKGDGAVAAKVAITVVNDRNEPIANALVKGFWSGSLAGKVNTKSAANGAVVQRVAARVKKNGGYATFTLAGIEAPGYVYSPEQNAKAVVTVAW